MKEKRYAAALDNVRRALSLLTQRQRREWALVVPLGFASGIVEAAAAACVFGIAAVLADTSRVVDLPLIRTIYQRLPVSWQEEAVMLKLFLVLAAGLFVAKTVFTLLNTLYTFRVAAHHRSYLAVKVYTGYLGLPYAFHLKRDAAGCIHRASDAVGMVFGHILEASVQFLNGALTLMSLLAVLLLASPEATLFTAFMVGGWVVLVTRATRRMLLELGRSTDDAFLTRNRLLLDGLGAIREIQVLGRAPYFTERYKSAHRALVRTEYVRAIITATPRVALEGIFLVIMLTAAALLLDTPGKAALVPLIGLYVYAGVRAMPTANLMVDAVNRILWATEPLNRLLEDWEAIERQEASLADDRPPASFQNRLELRDVSFTYEGSSEPVIHGAGLTIRPGEIIGMAGETGAGKSTLLHLIAGLIQPSSGTVTVDGADLARDARGWHSLLGYVPQAIYLLDSTIRRNIALGIPDDEISDERIHEVLRIVRLEDFVASLPEGLETVLGDRGVRLSGGQRQRIALGRALYHDPTVLLLDEATAALDVRTESHVMTALHAMRGTRTVVMIAHRLSSLAPCDRVVFVDDGRIVATDSFDELMRTCPQFRELVEAAS